MPDLDLYHPWELTVDDAIALGREAEAAALAVDRRITNTEGATVACSEAEFVYANSHGFAGGYRSSRHHIDCSVIGEDAGGMQRDYWYTAARAPSDLQPAATVGRIAGERTARRLNARQIEHDRVPGAVRGARGRRPDRLFRAAPCRAAALYRKSSFLLDSLGQAVFPPHVSIREEPHIPRGRGSAPFDNEGVATAPRDVVQRRRGRRATSSAAIRRASSGSRRPATRAAATISSSRHGADDLPALLRRMGRGLLVTEQLGQGVNPVTGDFSRGAAGFWVEDGEIAYPVEEITIAGNLKDMYRDIVAVGSDVDRRGSRHVGSILVGRMTVAGQ